MIAWLNSLKTLSAPWRARGHCTSSGSRPFAKPLTRALAWLRARPTYQASLAELGQTWKAMMPPNDQELFRITGNRRGGLCRNHLNCPLRGTGNGQACHALMNYDRSLLKAVGGQLEVLESQATSGKAFCRLAIRQFDVDRPQGQP